MAPLPGENLAKLQDALVRLKAATDDRRQFDKGTSEYVLAIEAETRLSQRIFDLAHALRSEHADD